MSYHLLYTLLRTRYYAKCFICIISFFKNALKTQERTTVIIIFILLMRKLEHKDPVSHSAKTTWPVSGRVRI